MKNSTLILSTLAACLAASQAYAHTGVRDSVTEGTGSYNAFTITHGCNNSYEGGPPAQQFPVIGQSAVFPQGDNVVWRDKAGAVIQVGGNGNNTIDNPTLNLRVAGIVPSPPFATIEEIVDSLGNVQGLLWKDGVMAPNLYSLTSFRISAPTIVDPCVTLKIRVGVINYCDVDKNAANDKLGPFNAPVDSLGNPVVKTTSAAGGFVQQNTSKADEFKSFAKSGNGDNNRADWWFKAPYGGSTYYADPDVVQPSYWTTMTVSNKSTDVCAGTKTEVSVEPTGAAFDTILSPANTQPFTKKGTKGSL